MTIFWLGLFIVSLMVLVKGADWFLASSEKFGLSVGISRFVVGVVIVGIGTSLPELFSSLFAVFSGAPEIVPANVIGSNIANILLIVGVSLLVARKISTTKYLIDIEIPLLVLSTVLFLITVWDRVVTFPEAILLLASYAVYLVYTFQEGKREGREEEKEHTKPRPRFTKRDGFILLAGLLGLIFGSRYLIDSIISLADIFRVSTGTISLVLVAVGTSLPELVVSMKAALQGKAEVALGNIFGSNVFNVLAVTGVPALFGNLPLDNATHIIGLPFLIIATFVFVLSGISQKIYIWEGAMYLIIYVFFIGKLFSIF